MTTTPNPELLLSNVIDHARSVIGEYVHVRRASVFTESIRTPHTYIPIWATPGHPVLVISLHYDNIVMQQALNMSLDTGLPRPLLSWTLTLMHEYIEHIPHADLAGRIFDSMWSGLLGRAILAELPFVRRTPEYAEVVEHMRNHVDPLDYARIAVGSEPLIELGRRGILERMAARELLRVGLDV